VSENEQSNAVTKSHEESKAAGITQQPPGDKKLTRMSSHYWRTVLFVLALVTAASAWLTYKTQQQLAVLGGEQEKLMVANKQLNKKIEQQVQRQAQQLSIKLQSDSDEVLAEQRKLSQQLEMIKISVDDHRQRLFELSTTDRKDWLLPEVEYLLRLANQRVLMAKDVSAAQVLLRSADDILLKLKDVTLHSIRAALAKDLAALRAVGDTDIQGAYLRLQALIIQIENLTLFRLPDPPSLSPVEIAEKGWRQQFDSGLQLALQRFSQYVTIKRRDHIYEPAMSSEWEGLVRQNLRMMLEQAQSALISGNTQLYQLSIEKSDYWVRHFFTVDEPATVALSAELKSLQNIVIAPILPDITASLQAVKNKLNDRYKLENSVSEKNEIPKEAVK
jgi:uroporphyrin-3 C-methyltransferase